MVKTMSMIWNHVNYIYGIGSGYDKHALKDINLEIKEGEFIGIVGHTGSGKSTLIQHMNGLLKPTSGEIYFHGQDIHDKDFDRKALRNKVGLVFQYPEYQLFEVSVFEDICFGPRNMGLPELEVEMRAYEAMKQVGLGEELLDVSPFELSGGQKRRVAIAGILAMRPEMLILDEPTAGLDPAGRDEILNLLEKLHREQNMTIVLVSHSMEDIARHAERMLVMKQGKIVLDGRPAEIFTYAKELEQIGLDVPQVTKVLTGLKGRGIDVDIRCLTVEAAAEEISRHIK